MAKNLVYLALFCLVTISLAAGDCNNPLLTALGFTKLNAPISGSAFKYCRTLQKGESCCSAEEINGIQDKVKTLEDKLTTSVITRDKAISEARDKLLPAFQQSLTNLKDAFTQAINAIKDDPTFSAAVSSAEAMKGITDGFETLSKQVDSGSGTLKKGFNGFQKSRTSCVIELLKLQSAAWCLACDPTYASQGVAGDSTITISDQVCKRLQSSCYSFVSDSGAQSALLSIKTLTAVMDFLTKLMQKFAKKDTSGITSMQDDLMSLIPSTGVDAPVAVPDSCSADKCDWICSSLLKKGKLDETALIVGGSVTDPTGLSALKGGKRLLEKEEGSVVKKNLSKRRNLATSEWNPEADEAGVSVAFQDDPAGVKTDDNGAGILRNGVFCLIAVLTAFLI